MEGRGHGRVVEGGGTRGGMEGGRADRGWREGARGWWGGRLQGEGGRERARGGSGSDDARQAESASGGREG